MLFLILLTRRVLTTGWRQLTACQQLFTHILLSCQSFDLVDLFTASLGKVTQLSGQLCLWQCYAFFKKKFLILLEEGGGIALSDALWTMNSWDATIRRNVSRDILLLPVLESCQYFILTRPKSAYGRQSLAGGIVEPGYSSSGYIFGYCQRLPLAFIPQALIYSHGWFQFEEVKIFCQLRGSQLTFLR